MSKDLLFLCLAIFSDGPPEILDMEEPGYRDRLHLAVQLTLVPKKGVSASDGTPFQNVTVQIPPGATPILMTRKKASFNTVDGTPLGGIRIYGVGYAVGEAKTIVWILPDGSIEVGEDSHLADLLLAQQNRGI